MENNQVTYTYSAAENEEIKKIRQKYEMKSEKEVTLEKIRKLDRSVNEIATAVSICTGCIGTLVFGAGFSIIMMYADKYFRAGVILGLIGLTIAVLAYPINQLVIYKRRKKISPIILELTDTLMSKNSQRTFNIS